MSDLKSKWLKALRSEDFRQARSRLKRGDRFCCLGVLCEISNAGEWETVEIYGDRGLSYRCEDENDAYLLPKCINLKSKIDSPMSKLTTMNDSGQTFRQIADWIEVNIDSVEIAEPKNVAGEPTSDSPEV